jgi:adenosylcobinamide-GDP ribazoletransferase
VVGLGLGALLAGAFLGLDRAVPPAVGAVLVVAAWAGLTGGLHLDGLADAADGLGGGWSRDEALAIMRDVRTGAYGVTAIVLVLAAKLAALAALPPEAAWRGLVVAPVIARLGPVLLARFCPPARGEGAGHAFALSVSTPALVAAAAVATATPLALLGVAGLLLLGGAVGAAGLFGGYLRWRLGGLTGDCLGAYVEVVEAGVLVALTAVTVGGRP